MNTLILAFGAIMLFWLGYRFYSQAYKGVWDIDAGRKTPAERHNDGLDYVPAKHWTVLFGHHFASIAGAGPIIGPIIALSLWGWLPSLLWIVLGTIFIGGVHDFSALMVSLRHDGTSIADVAKTVISHRAKIAFSIFIWLALILVIAVFTHFCAATFVVDGRIVLPSLGLIPLAILVGLALYNLKLNQTVVTILGLVTLLGLIILGYYFPIRLIGLNLFILTLSPLKIWSIVLLIYCFFASCAPVQILLQPRDYLCAFLLFVGVILGAIGIVVAHPRIQLPAFISWQASEGPLWPMLFVTVACGAISGFHALIASGTTSKQLANEKDAYKIGYGAMVAEGVVALLVLLIVAGTMANLETIQQMLKQGGGPVSVFSQGFAQVTKSFLGGYGGVIAVTIVNAFILTTLDTATRIGRYLTQELLGLKNRYLATLLVVVFGGALALSGKWSAIWPMFGSANQLVAALTLIVVTSWLLSRRKSIKFVFLPALIMLLTTIGALFYQLIGFFRAAQKDWLLISIAFILLGLAFNMLLEVKIILVSALKKKPETSNQKPD